MRTLADGGSGEERGDLKAPPSCGECESALVSRAAACEGAEPASLRFFVEAVVKFGAYLEPAKLQSRQKGGREGVKDASGHPQPTLCVLGSKHGKAGGRSVCAAAAMGTERAVEPRAVRIQRVTARYMGRPPTERSMMGVQGWQANRRRLALTT